MLQRLQRRSSFELEGKNWIHVRACDVCHVCGGRDSGVPEYWELMWWITDIDTRVESRIVQLDMAVKHLGC